MFKNLKIGVRLGWDFWFVTVFLVPFACIPRAQRAQFEVGIDGTTFPKTVMPG